MPCARCSRVLRHWLRRPLRRNADGPGMIDAPMSLPTVPPYGEGSLADLACSLLASLGVGGEPNPLGLPEATRACLLIAAGPCLGQLRAHPAPAPFLSELAVTGRPLTSGFPATTVTSLTS